MKYIKTRMLMTLAGWNWKIGGHPFFLINEYACIHKLPIFQITTLPVYLSC